MAVKRNKLLSKYNRTILQRNKKDIKYIVVHYVGALGDARANAAWYAGGDRRASADFYVGFSGDVWQGNNYYTGYSWHCGGGRQSSHGGAFFGQCKNSNSVGIEMCVRKRSTKSMQATDADWFFEDATVQATVQLVQELMRELDIDIDHVIRHYDVTGKYCPNPYLDELHPGEWAKFKALVSGSAPAEVQWYRVRKSWKDEKSQLGAYEQLANAKHNCPSGYSVYDSTGRCIYTAPATVKPAKTGLQQSDLQGLTEEQFIAKIRPLAQADMQKTGVLASITLAQCILESGWASTELARKANNLFGMKVVLSNNNWPSVWDGKSQVNIRTQEQTKNGAVYYIHADFRQYPCIEDSLADHSAYLTGAKNGSRLRYAGLKGCTDYVQAATIIKRGGYATDVEYVQKLTRIIKKYDLTRFDVIKDESKAVTTISGWLQAIQDWEQQMLKAGAVYSNSNNKTSYKTTLKSSPVYTNCALFVSHALQTAGLLTEKEKFWGQKGGALKGSGVTHLKQITNITVYPANTTVTDVQLQPGDIVTYQEQHTNVYLGKDASGRMMWSDAGRGTTVKGCEKSGWKSYRKTGTMSGFHVANVIRLHLVAGDTVKSTPKTEFQVRVTSDVLRIRRGAGTRYDAIGYTGKGVFTIVDTCDGWGKLKSGVGWIYLGLKCVQKL